MQIADILLTKPEAKSEKETIAEVEKAIKEAQESVRVMNCTRTGERALLRFNRHYDKGRQLLLKAVQMDELVKSLFLISECRKVIIPDYICFRRCREYERCL